MRRLVASILTVAACSGLACAQSGYAIWQCSIDDGATWDATLTVAGGTSVRIRLMMGWENVPDALGFGGSQFDAIVQNARVGDVVTQMARPSPFNFAAQTIAATPYSEGIKIDAASDTSDPGAGSGWIQPGQGSLDGMPTNFNTSNPTVVFTYTLTLGHEVGTRTISNIFNNHIGGRAMSLYTGGSGGSFRFTAGLVEITSAQVIVIPAPASTLAALCMSLMGVQRPRRFKKPGV